MIPKCKFCGCRADFSYEKKATPESPMVIEKADYCHECYEQHMEPGEYDPVQVKDMALEYLRKHKETN